MSENRKNNFEIFSDVVSGIQIELPAEIALEIVMSLARSGIESARRGKTLAAETEMNAIAAFADCWRAGKIELAVPRYTPVGIPGTARRRRAT